MKAIAMMEMMLIPVEYDATDEQETEIEKLNGDKRSLNRSERFAANQIRITDFTELLEQLRTLPATRTISWLSNSISSRAL
jgi:hypothetical protein